jgi:pyrophosphatase PpaX
MLLLFDLDGTLIDTSRLFLEGIPPIVRRHLGLEVSRADLVQVWGVPARRKFIRFAEMAGVDDDPVVEEMHAEFEHFYNSCHDGLSTTYAEVEENLSRLRAKVRAMGVVTTRPTSRSAMIAGWPWAKYLDFFVWGDKVSHAKPAPDGLELAIRRYGVNGETVVYVGDNNHDIEAARHCRGKVYSVAALWGAMDEEKLLTAGPDYSFRTFKAFADWIIDNPSD